MYQELLYSNEYRIEKLNNRNKKFYYLPFHISQFEEGAIYKLHSNDNKESKIIKLNSYEVIYRIENYARIPEQKPIVVTTSFIDYVEMDCLVTQNALEQLILIYGKQTPQQKEYLLF